MKNIAVVAAVAAAFLGQARADEGKIDGNEWQDHPWALYDKMSVVFICPNKKGDVR